MLLFKLISKFNSRLKAAPSGFSLIELLVCVAIFSILGATIVGSLAYGSKAAINAGYTTRANMLAEEGLEASRNIRDNNFANLVNGTFGLAITGNQWVYSGASDVTNGFTRTVAISTVSAVMKQVTSTVTWTPPGATTTKSIVHTTHLGNTGLMTLQSNCLTINTGGFSTSGLDVLGLTLQNTCATAIIIDRMTVSWTNSQLLTMSNIRINGTSVFTGSAANGTNNDITNTTIAATTTLPLNRIRFTGTMGAGTYTLTATMTDGSTKTVTFP